MAEKIPQDMQEVNDQVTLMQARGFDVTPEDVIQEALKLGFQSIVDDRLDGNYDTVRWDADLNALQLVGFDDELEGETKPAEGEPSFVEQFKENPSRLWFKLDNEAGRIIGR
ncbi:hypothetical protein JOC36_000433 [Weissella uvarum]|uniref:hypothetical protein n=1 Tax=Weissella uvarum TaxID=1479233 RepID=UPI00196182DB|nr:hypothetical protein [Weissella uvarum]MBM7616900.1 hypothetical protein [Weissella uvarum]MCM0594648.1 hypothetical protein [Weissella uvarum]